MAFIVPEPVEDYALAHTTPHAELLARLTAETHEHTSAPQMLTGPVEGRLLETLVFATGARNILEIGTFTGYSALSMAAALPDDGRVVTCEYEEKHAEIARRYFAQSPHGHKVDLRMGPAIDTVTAEPGPWDLVFIDADKTGYRAYYDEVVPKLAPRGLIAIDNILWSGRVAQPPTETDDESTRALRDLAAYIAADDRVVQVMLTVRDGLLLVRRAGGPAA